MSKHKVEKDKVETTEKEGEIPKPQTTPLAKKDEPGNDKEKEEEEHDLEEIEKELDELRPPPPSPETKRRMEAEEKRKDQEIQHGQDEKSPSMPVKVDSDKHEHSEHKDNELTPGEPDPSVNENTKIPVLNDHGDVELKPQQGSVFKKDQNKNANEYTEGNKITKDNNAKPSQAAPEGKTEKKNQNWYQVYFPVFIWFQASSSFHFLVLILAWLNSIDKTIMSARRLYDDRLGRDLVNANRERKNPSKSPMTVVEHVLDFAGATLRLVSLIETALSMSRMRNMVCLDWEEHVLTKISDKLSDFISVRQWSEIVHSTIIPVSTEQATQDQQSQWSITQACIESTRVSHLWFELTLCSHLETPTPVAFFFVVVFLWNLDEYLTWWIYRYQLKIHLWAMRGSFTFSRGQQHRALKSVCAATWKSLSFIDHQQQAYL